MTTKLKTIQKHFETADQRIFAVLGAMNLELLSREEDPKRYFPKLCREIIGQQLGSKAAEAIAGRFTALFPDQKIIPERMLEYSEDALRNTGMSWAKVRSVQDLALKTIKGELPFAEFPHLDDEEVIAALSKVRGIGRWTGEMFLMFTLGREDVFSHGDLGLKKGLAEIYGRSGASTSESIQKITKLWSPYRSYGSLAVWHIADSMK